MGASEVVSVVCHASSVCFSVVSGQRSCGLVSWVDGRVERIDGTDVCCTKLQKTKETGLVFPQLERSHIFCVLTAILEVHVTPPAVLFFPTMVVT